MKKIDFKKILLIQTGGHGAQIHTDHEVKLMFEEVLKQAIPIVLKAAADKSRPHYLATLNEWTDDKQEILSLESELFKKLKP